MHNVAITGTGVFTPEQVITNDELVVAFNAHVERFNTHHAAAIEAGTVEAKAHSSSEFIVNASGIEQRYVMNKSGVLDPEVMHPHLPERPDDAPGIMAEMALEACTIALAQAAKESAWGISRFDRLGNNYFGQWCFVAGCGLVPEARNTGASHEVAAFKSVRESVRRYMNNINTHPAYADLRNRRASLRSEGNDISGLALAPALIRYSERGQEYVSELQAMIRGNELQQYD